jgi:hypothetical protein
VLNAAPVALREAFAALAMHQIRFPKGNTTKTATKKTTRQSENNAFSL